MSNTIQINDTLRIRVEQDQDASNPRTDWDTWLTGFVKMPGVGDSRYIDVAPVYDFPGDRLVDAAERLEGSHYQRGWSDSVQRWAHIFHGITVVYDHTHGGYWFVNPDLLAENFTAIATTPTTTLYQYGDDVLTKPELERKVIEQEQKTYEQWAEGEVYGVILERAAPWEKTYVNGGDTVEGVDWVEVGSLWGCYLDDTYTAQEVAKELDDSELDAEQQAALAAL